MFILRLKHWQIFIIMIIAFTLMNLSINSETSGILVTIGGLTWFSWMFLTGNSLYQLLPAKIQLNHTLYIINSFLWLGCYAAIMIISDGEGMSFSGLEAIPFFYVAFAFLHFLAFPPKVLVSLEKDKEATFGEYVGTFILMFLTPIGIWFIQPRINKIVKQSLNPKI